MPTCQICGREIKANTGLIAHHGYKRPFQYYQTSSCFGARRRPYEVAHDALDEYIVLLEGWLKDAQAAYQAYLDNPPAEITYQRRNAWGETKGPARVFTMPPDFSPVGVSRYALSDTYDYHYCARVREHDQTCRHIAEDLRSCRERRAAWKEAA